MKKIINIITKLGNSLFTLIDDKNSKYIIGFIFIGTVIGAVLYILNYFIKSNRYKFNKKAIQKNVVVDIVFSSIFVSLFTFLLFHYLPSFVTTIPEKIDTLKKSPQALEKINDAINPLLLSQERANVLICYAWIPFLLLAIYLFVIGHKNLIDCWTWIAKFGLVISTIQFLGYIYFNTNGVYLSESIIRGIVSGFLVCFIKLTPFVIYNGNNVSDIGIDAPKTKYEDLFKERKNQVDNIIELLDLHKSKEHFAILLTGGWGTGKTSVMNAIEDKLSLRNPKNEMAYDFITVSAGYTCETGEILKDIEKQMSNIFDRGLFYHGLSRAIQKYFKLMCDFADEYTHSLSGFFYSQMCDNDTLNQAKNKINRLLNSYTVKTNRKIVIVIDDLERSSSDNVKNIFAVLMETTRLECCITIVVCDLDKLNLDNSGGEKKYRPSRYLYKYFNKAVALQPVDPAEMIYSIIEKDRLIEDEEMHDLIKSTDANIGCNNQYLLFFSHLIKEILKYQNNDDIIAEYYSSINIFDNLANPRFINRLWQKTRYYIDKVTEYIKSNGLAEGSVFYNMDFSATIVCFVFMEEVFPNVWKDLLNTDDRENFSYWIFDRYNDDPEYIAFNKLINNSSFEIDYNFIYIQNGVEKDVEKETLIKKLRENDKIDTKDLSAYINMKGLYPEYNRRILKAIIESDKVGNVYEAFVMIDKVFSDVLAFNTNSKEASEALIEFILFYSEKIDDTKNNYYSIAKNDLLEKSKWVYSVLINTFNGAYEVCQKYISDKNELNIDITKEENIYALRQFYMDLNKSLKKHTFIINPSPMDFYANEFQKIYKILHENFEEVRNSEAIANSTIVLLSYLCTQVGYLAETSSIWNEFLKS